MSRLPRVSVLILNWNNWRETSECILAVSQSDYKNLAIVVIDNGSADGSERELRKRFSDITLIQTGANLGYAGGNNAGIRQAVKEDSDYVVILNNDCRVAKDCISQMVAAAAGQAKIGMVSPKVYAEGDIISHAGSEFDWRNRYVTTSIGAGARDKGQFDERKFIETATGDCLLVSTTLIDEIGLMDESYFLYYEDSDWCFRTRQAGYAITYEPKAVAVHPGSLSTGGVTGPVGAYYILRNKLYFVQKYGNSAARRQNWIHFVLSLSKNFIDFSIPSRRRPAMARLMALKDFALRRKGINRKVAAL